MQKRILYFLLPLAVLVFLTACGEKASKDTANSETAAKMETMPHAQMASDTTGLAADEVIDPVCGMKVKKTAAADSMTVDGKTYYFCMKGDYETFAANPQKFINQPKG